MNIFKLAAAAAIVVSGFSLPAAAQDHHGDRDRYEHSDRDRDYRHDNGRHYGWRNHHRRHRVCRWVWRHHHRTRVCTWRRW